MNAPAIITDVEPIATLEEFQELGFDYVDWWRAGILVKTDAVDRVQRHAELWGMVDALGQDEVQRLMAGAFEAQPLPYDYAAQILMQMELADPRDRWRHIGERPPPASVRNGDISGRPESLKAGYATPDSTEAAFWYVVSLENPARLRAWLADHPRDLPYLLKLLESK